MTPEERQSVLALLPPGTTLVSGRLAERTAPEDPGRKCNFVLRVACELAVGGDGPTPETAMWAAVKEVRDILIQ